MAGTAIRPQTLTPLASGVGGVIQGDAATGHLQRHVDKFFRALEPRRTAFLNKVKKAEAANQVKIEWGQKFRRPLATTFGASYTSGATSLTVATGDGAILQQYMVLRAIDSTTNDEIFWLSADMPASGDVISGVKGAQGGTSAANHASGVTLEIIGTAIPYGVDHVQSPTYAGQFVYNQFQRFGGSINADKAQLATPDWENLSPKKMAELIREEAANQKYMLQKAVLYGGRQAASNSTTPRTPGMMGGWREFVTTHVTNKSQQPVSIWDIDNLASAAWYDVEDEVALTLVMSMNMKRALGRRVAPLREFTHTANSVDFRLNSLMLDVGEVNIMVVPEFPEGEIWGVNFDMLELVPYVGLDWHFSDLPASGEYEWQAVSADYSFRVKAEHSQFRIRNIATNLDLYSKGAW